MDKQARIDKIYEVIADKTLSFGCKILDKKYMFFGKSSPIEFLTASEVSQEDIDCEGGTQLRTEHYRGHIRVNSDEFKNEENYKIIGHPVMIGDVLDWIYEKKLNMNCGSCGGDKVRKIPRLYEETLECDNCGEGISFATDSLVYLYLYKRQPIEDQSDECIDFVYSLIE